MEDSRRKIATDYYQAHSSDEGLYDEKKRQARYLIERLGKLKIRSGAKLLDVACGIGVFGETFKDRYGISVWGADLSQRSLKEANKRGVKTFLVDIDKKWPFNNSFFDVVLSMQTVEHLLNPDNFFQEAKRVLKKNGVLIITTPNLACWFNRIIFLFGYQPFFTEVSTKDKTLGLSFTRGMSPHREPLGHLRVFTLKALAEILAFHGFSVMRKIGGEVTYLPPWMKPFDKFFANFPSLATDLIAVAKKKR